MNKIRSKLNSAYIKDILTSFTGTTLSQAITIAMAPILTRIYTPSDYGLLGIYMSVTVILYVFVNLQYSQAILLTESKEEEDNVVFLCFTISIFYTICITAFLLLLHFFEFSFFTNAKLGYWLFLIPISIFLNGNNTLGFKLLNKYKKYKGLSISQIISSITTVFFSLILGWMYQSYEGLLIGFLLGQLSKLVVIIIYIKNVNFNKKNITKKSLKFVIKKYKKFPIFSIPTEFLYGWTDQLPVYFFNSYGSTTIIGHFNYGKRMVSLPISFITAAVGNVFAQKAAEQYSETGECEKLFIDTLKILSLSILPFFILLGFFAPVIFGFVFGSEWRRAGEFVQILIPMFYLKAIVSPLSYMYIIKNKQDEDLILHLISFGLVAFSFYISYLLKSDIKTILYMFTFSYCLIYIVYLYRSYKFSLKK